MKKFFAIIATFLIFISAFSGVMPISAESGDWPNAFYNSSHTNNSNGPDVPTPLMRHWSFYPEGEQLSFPVVLGDKIFVGDDVGYIYAVDKNTGQQIWRFDAEFDAPAMVGSSSVGSLVYSTMSLMNFGSSRRGRGGGGGGGRGGGGGGGGGPHPLSLHSVLPEEEQPPDSIGTLDKETGKLLWRNEYKDFSVGLPTIHEDKMVVPFIKKNSDTFDTQLACISIVDGKELWKIDYPKSFGSTKPMIFNNKVVLSAMKLEIDETTKMPVPTDPELVCLKLSDGSIIWKKADFDGNMQGWTSYENGVIYMSDVKWENTQGGGAGFVPPKSTFMALKESDASVIWKSELEGDFVIFGPPAITTHGLIIQAAFSNTYCLDKETGKTLWKVEKMPGGFALGITLACTRNQMINVRQSKISILDMVKKEVVFFEDTGMKTSMMDMKLSFPVISGDKVYVAGDRLICFGIKIIKLYSDPEILNIERIIVGEKKTRPIKVVYNDVAEISGTITTKTPWIKLSTGEYKLASQSVDVTVSAEGMEPGEYTGSIDVDASVGKISIPVKMTVVPKPAIKMVINIEDLVFTNKNPFPISGETVPGAKLTVSGRPITVGSDGKFKDEIPLKEGENRLVFDASDSKGNKATAVRMVILDDKKPRLQVSLKDNTLISEFPFTFSGQTEKGAKVKVNNNPVEVADNGEFEAVIDMLPPGPGVIAVTSEDRAGNVTKLELKVIVDTKKITISLDGFDPTSMKPMVTNTGKLTVTGKTEPGIMVTYMVIGDTEENAPVLADAEGKFKLEITIKDEGMKRVVIQAFDETGKSASQMLMVVFDKTPPEITCEIPTTVAEPKLTLKGTVSEPCMLTINAAPVQVDPKALTFETTIELKTGLNPIKFVAKDMAGNEAKLDKFVKFEAKVEVKPIVIELWLGKTTWTVNGTQETALKAAPVNTAPPLPKELAGNTYMPITEVAKALNATVDWDGKEKKVTLTQTLPSGAKKVIQVWIGKKTAVIDGVETQIDSKGKLYPAIVAGKTMLPLRFAGTSLGCNVDYHAADKRITLTFMAK
jgi:outer membrane protein assembly factor BamB